MYNKTKRGLDLTGSIIAIIIGAIEIIAGFYCIITILPLLEHIGVEYQELMTPVILASVADIALGVSMVCVGSKLCFAPKKINGEWERNTGKNITLLVFYGLLILLYIIAMTSNVLAMATSSNALRILLLFVTLTGLTLKIVAMCLKPEVGGVIATGQTTNIYEPVSVDSAIVNKIKELKHLKELGIITDEQYDMAIAKLLKDVL